VLQVVVSIAKSISLENLVNFVGCFPTFMQRRAGQPWMGAAR
jgi:hypothetical protein